MNIREAFYINENGSRPNAPIVVCPIKSYIIVIQFDKNDSHLNSAEIKNMEDYGWKGIVATDYQEAEKELKKEIKAQNLDISVGVDRVIIFSHGSSVTLGNKMSSFVSTNHQSGKEAKLSGFNFLYLDKVENEYPKEIEKATEGYSKRMAERKIEALSSQIRINIRRKDKLTPAELEHLAQYPDPDIAPKDMEKLKKGKDIVLLNEHLNSSSIDYTKLSDLKDAQDEDDRTYNQLISDTESNIKWANKEFITEQVKKDFASLKNIVSCIKDNGHLIFAACNSALDYTKKEQAACFLLEEVSKYTNRKVNIVGFEYLTAYSREEKTGGVLNGETLFGGKIEFLLIDKLKGKNNYAKIISIDGSESSSYNIKLIKNGIEFIKGE